MPIVSPRNGHAQAEPSTEPARLDSLRASITYLAVDDARQDACARPCTRFSMERRLATDPPRLLGRLDDEVALPPGQPMIAVSRESQRSTGVTMTRFSMVGLSFGSLMLTLSGLLYSRPNYSWLSHDAALDHTVPDILATAALGVLASNVVGLGVGLGLRSRRPHMVQPRDASPTAFPPTVGIAPVLHGGATLTLAFRF